MIKGLVFNHGLFLLNKTSEGNDFMNDIIEITNLTPIEIALRIDKDGMTTARNLYDFLELDKSNYSKWCKTNILENLFAEKDTDYKVFVPKDENPNGGRPTKDYRITATFAKKLAMACKNEKGEQARCYFIACEQSLVKIAEERKQWEIERAKGVLVRHILTDTIKMKVADSPNKRFMYPNYTKLIYKVMFGKSFKELQEQFGIKPKESLREYLTSEQLKEVEQMEMLISSLIGVGMGYEEIKSFVNEKYKSCMLIAG